MSLQFEAQRSLRTSITREGDLWSATTSGLSFAIIESLARAMTARDALTHEHAQRVQRYAIALALEVGVVDEHMLDAIDAAALLHDIGKLGIPDSVLLKPGPLTPEEYQQVQQHVVIGADILSAVSFPGPLALIVRHHHENWDGSGYPDRLIGDAIPLGARVLAIADGYDALTSNRPYRPEMPHDQAVSVIREKRGVMYDPAIADAFLRIAPRVRSAPTRQRSATTTFATWLRQASAI